MEPERQSEAPPAQEKSALGRPALHLIVALFALLVLLLPLLHPGSPTRTVVCMYGMWTAAIAVSFVLSRARESAGEDGEDEVH